jgi:hypothetical protein
MGVVPQRSGSRNLGDSILDTWPTVDHWLQYGDDVESVDLRYRCRSKVPAVRHPLLEERGEWVEAFSSEVMTILDGEIPHWTRPTASR